MKEKFKNTDIQNENKHYSKLKDKNIINITKLIIVIIFITFVIFLVVFINNRNLIDKNFGKEIKQENEQEKSLLSFIAYDNQNEQNIKGMIIINSTSTIDYVEFLDGTIVYGNGKSKIVKDIEISKDQEYSAKIISGGIEKVEKIRIDDNYLEKMITFNEIEVAEGENKKIEIKDNREIEGMTTFYKIGKNTSSNWVPYSQKIELDESCIDIEDYANKNYISTIYTMTVDKAGNQLFIDKTFSINKRGELDIFRNVLVSGTLEQYGFTSNFVNCGDEKGWSFFEIGKIGAGRSLGYSSYSGTFKLNWSKLKKLKAKELSIGGYQYSERWDSWVETTITVFYTDGTTDVKQLERVNSGLKNYNTTISLQKEKEIAYVQFYINRI